MTGATTVSLKRLRMRSPTRQPRIERAAQMPRPSRKNRADVAAHAADDRARLKINANDKGDDNGKGATHATVPLLLRRCGHSLPQRQSSRGRRPQYRKSWGNDAEHFTNGCAKIAGPSPCAFASTAGKDTTGREFGGH